MSLKLHDAYASICDRSASRFTRSKFQEDVQMARALSASLSTAAADREDAQRRFRQLFTGGHHHVGRRKKLVEYVRPARLPLATSRNNLTLTLICPPRRETPVLLTRTDEERVKRTEEKIDHLLTQRVSARRPRERASRV